MINRIKTLIKKFILKSFFPKADSHMEERFIKEALRFFTLTSKYNASHHTDDDMEKMQYTLLRENHVIEKGMSMRHPRKGFGQQKVLDLLIRLKKYQQMYGDKDLHFLVYPLSTIKTYIKYTENEGVKIDKIKNLFNEIALSFSPIQIQAHGGVEVVTKDDILKSCNCDFKSLLYSRHSIRYFSSEAISQDLIIDILKLAQRTPSACNRQGWKTHVFSCEKSVELMKWQGGCHGFETELQHSILVTANLKAFLYYEVHQAYVDGGLYAMNLINAIHSFGLGCIPLSCGFEYEKLKGLSKFGIPENEVPIVIVAFGKLLDEFKVAVSTRKEISETNTFH